MSQTSGLFDQSAGARAVLSVAEKLRAQIQEEAPWFPGGLLMSSILTVSLGMSLSSLEKGLSSSLARMPSGVPLSPAELWECRGGDAE